MLQESYVSSLWERHFDIFTLHSYLYCIHTLFDVGWYFTSCSYLFKPWPAIVVGVTCIHTYCATAFLMTATPDIPPPPSPSLPLRTFENLQGLPLSAGPGFPWFLKEQMCFLFRFAFLRGYRIFAGFFQGSVKFGISLGVRHMRGRAKVGGVQLLHAMASPISN